MSKRRYLQPGQMELNGHCGGVRKNPQNPPAYGPDYLVIFLSVRNFDRVVFIQRFRVFWAICPIGYARHLAARLEQPPCIF